MANNDRDLSRPALGDRSLFPRLGVMSYLSHGGISPLSDPVAAAANAWIEDFARMGAVAFKGWAAKHEQLRTDLAELIGAQPSDLAFIANTAHGVNAIAFGLPWQRGDRVVVLDGEYPSNVVPWQRAAETFALEVHTIDVGSFAARPISWAQLDRALEKKPRVIAVSAVQFQTGLRMPLREISERAHAVGTHLFVDGVQACGVVPIDVVADGIDYLACGSHKWLMGMSGAGFLYVSPRCMAGLRPRITGAMSYEGAPEMLFAGMGPLRYDRPARQDARAFEGGMLAGAPLAALAAAVRLVRQLGVAAIFDHVQRVHDAFEPRLIERGFRSLRHADHARRSGILSFEPPPGVNAPELCAQLVDHGIVCSSPAGVFRIAPHWPNAVSEVAPVIAAIDACLARLPE